MKNIFENQKFQKWGSLKFRRVDHPSQLHPHSFTHTLFIRHLRVSFMSRWSGISVVLVTKVFIIGGLIKVFLYYILYSSFFCSSYLDVYQVWKDILFFIIDFYICHWSWNTIMRYFEVLLSSMLFSYHKTLLNSYSFNYTVAMIYSIIRHALICFYINYFEIIFACHLNCYFKKIITEVIYSWT